MVRTVGLERPRTRGLPWHKVLNFYFRSPCKPFPAPDMGTQLAMIVCVRKSVATTATHSDFHVQHVGDWPGKPTLDYCPHSSDHRDRWRALTIALLCRAISSAHRAMRSNHPCNQLHYTGRSSARKVGPNTQQVPDVRVRLHAALPEGIGVVCSSCPVGQQGEDCRAMRAICKPRGSDFEGAMR
jgi:hypothetical protein